MVLMECTSVKGKAHLTGSGFILGSSSLGRMLDSSPPSASICKFASSQSSVEARSLNRRSQTERIAFSSWTSSSQDSIHV